MTDEAEISRRVTAALKNVGMEKYALRTPDTLSGGQQQRVAIARAIVKNPRVILADEPTGNLDEANTVMIMDLLKRIACDHLVLLVTHEENLVMQSAIAKCGFTRCGIIYLESGDPRIAYEKL